MNAQAIMAKLTDMHIRNPRLLAGLIAAKSISVDDGAGLIETMIRDAAREFEQRTPSISLDRNWVGNAGFVLGRERVYVAMSTLPALDRAAERLYDAILLNYPDQVNPPPPAVVHIRAALVDELARLCESLVEDFAAGRDPKQGFFDHEYLFSRIVEAADTKAECDRDLQAARAEHLRTLDQQPSEDWATEVPSTGTVKTTTA